MVKELLIHNHKGEVCKKWEQRQLTQRDPVQACEAGAGTARAHLGLSLMSSMECKHKGSRRYISMEQEKTHHQPWMGLGPWWQRTWKSLLGSISFSTSHFTAETSLRNPLLGPLGMCGGRRAGEGAVDTQDMPRARGRTGCAQGCPGGTGLPAGHCLPAWKLPWPGEPQPLALGSPQRGQSRASKAHCSPRKGIAASPPRNPFQVLPYPSKNLLPWVLLPYPALFYFCQLTSQDSSLKSCTLTQTSLVSTTPQSILLWAAFPLPSDVSWMSFLPSSSQFPHPHGTSCASLPPWAELDSV